MLGAVYSLLVNNTPGMVVFAMIAVGMDARKVVRDLVRAAMAADPASDEDGDSSLRH